VNDFDFDPQRRRLLQATAGGVVLLAGGCGPAAGEGEVVQDVTRLRDFPVAAIARPASTLEVARQLSDWPGAVSIGGGRYSMGGQIAAEGSLHLDMRGLSRLIHLDPAARTVRAQAGMTWRDLQDHLDPHDLSVAIMQSYSNFTLGGSVSVNCHGRYVGKGPIVNSVRALSLVTADGVARELDRTQEPELFAAVVGGYGGLGVITEVELDLDVNTRIRRQMEQVALEDYPAYFRERVQADPEVLLHNADLAPPDFDRPLAISWRRTDEPLTVTDRLVPRDLDYGKDQNLIWAASELPGGGVLRQKFQASTLAEPAPVMWRNREASLDAASLEPRTRRMSTYVLQEYFVPVKGFLPFAQRMARILKINGANALNVSIRHSPPDRTSLMRWAADEVFCFVLYYKQRSHRYASHSVQKWTRELIDAALDEGGRYYLPYRLHATPDQFRRAYPEAARFADLKRRWDPDNRMRNALWDKYLG
jgi:FAD/FMN-containing dehydrogenase